MDINQMTDQEIVTAILRRDSRVTKEFLYLKCYPLFNHLFRTYHTDCQNCVEFIGEIYAYLLYPGKITRRSKLEGFEFKSSLVGWIFAVSKNYCKQVYALKKNLPTNSIDEVDIILPDDHSLEKTTNNLNMEDLSKILSSMNNKSYAALIDYRYVKNFDNKETAKLLNETMENYYNMHKRAKAQFVAELKKEGLV